MEENEVVFVKLFWGMLLYVQYNSQELEYYAIVFPSLPFPFFQKSDFHLMKENEFLMLRSHFIQIAVYIQWVFF